MTAEENKNKVVRECIEALKAAGFVDVGFLNRLIVQNNPNINTKSFLAYCEGQNKSLTKTVVNLRDYEFEGLMDTIESYADSLAKERAAELLPDGDQINKAAEEYSKEFYHSNEHLNGFLAGVKFVEDHMNDTFLAEKRKEGEHEWFCPKCNEVVPSSHVTNDELHDIDSCRSVVHTRKEGAE